MPTHAYGSAAPARADALAAAAAAAAANAAAADAAAGSRALALAVALPLALVASFAAAVAVFALRMRAARQRQRRGLAHTAAPLRAGSVALAAQPSVPQFFERRESLTSASGSGERIKLNPIATLQTATKV